jgi:hypothetical protein
VRGRFEMSVGLEVGKLEIFVEEDEESEDSPPLPPPATLKFSRPRFERDCC